MKTFRYVILVVLGLLAGLAIAAPGIVRGLGSSALESAEEALGADIEMSEVDWSWSGDIAVTGLRVAMRDVPVGEPPLLEASSLTMDLDVLLTRAKVRLDSVQVKDPIFRPTRRADGSTNLDSINRFVSRLSKKSDKERGERSGGRIGKYIDRTLPELNVEELTVEAKVIHPMMQVLGLPLELRLSGGTVTANNTALLREDDNLTWRVDFAETNLDPGHGLAISGTWPLRGFDLSNAPFEMQFDRPLSARLKRRELSLLGASWDGVNFILSRLSLSHHQPTGDDSNAEQPPDFEIARFVVEPDVQATLASATRLLGAEDRAEGVRTLLRTLKRIELDRPRLVFKRYDGGHNFSDFISKEEDLVRLQAAEIERSLGPLLIANRAAIARLTEVKRPDEGAKFRETLTSLFTDIEEGLRGSQARALSAAGRFPFREVTVRGGYFGWEDEQRVTPGSPHLAEVENFDLELTRDGDVLSFKTAFQVPGDADDVNRLEGKLQLQTGGLQVSAVIDRLRLIPYVHLLPKALRLDASTTVEKTDLTFVWSPDSNKASVEGVIATTNLGFENRLLAAKPMTGISGSLRLKAELDTTERRLTVEQSDVRLGSVAGVFHFGVTDYASVPKLKGAFRLHRSRAQDLLDAVPLQLMPLLEGVQLAGTVAWQLDFSLDTGDMESLEYNAYPELNHLAVVDLGRWLNIEEKRGRFVHRVVERDGEVREFAMGAGSPRWVSIANISKNMVKAVTTTEDGSFYRHKGFSPYAIKQSLVTNLKKGAFVRGASTISQQLVKNLFLTREKTISRKLQEVFVTWQVENSFTKSQIMELYLNVIEFGPGIYGLKQAARYYFGKSAANLSPLEAVFLASLIPNPKRYHYQFARGEVSDRWRRHLRWIMGVMVDRGKLTSDEFDAAAPFSPRFRTAQADVSPVDDAGDDEPPPLPDGFPPIPDDNGPATGNYE